MEPKRGLGRGLSALLGDPADAPAQDAASGVAGQRILPIELIRRNPDQPRKHFSEAEIEELAASIREKGVLQPILVRPAPNAPGEYQIVAGERRWRAAQKAGLREAPVVVRELDDVEALEIAILENVQRADLNPVEEAAGYKALMERFGRTQEAVAEAVGKSRSHVANALRLLGLPPGVQAMLVEGRLTAGHARAVLASGEPEALAQRILDEGLSVREAEAAARDTASRTAPKPKKGKDVNTLDLEKRLSEALGLIVEIDDRGGAGEVRVKYRSLEQLDMVCKKLLKPGW